MSMKQSAKPHELYFACAPGYLDVYTLSYRWFGAVWTFHDSMQQVIKGYWFGNGANDIIEQAKHAGWHSFVQVKDESEINIIYGTFRRRQKELDWDKRSLWLMRSLFSKPWKTAKPGWYIIRSRDQFPLYISCVQKKGWFVFLEHVDVCENDTEIRNFVNRVNCEHHIKLSIDSRQ